MAALPLHISKDDKILILAPHPDDECIGVGGLLVKYASLCTVIVMTDGCLGGNSTLPEEERKIRRVQFENEMVYVRTASYKWMGYEDGTLMYQKACMNEIEFEKYTKVFIPKMDDDHLDHTATFIYAINKIKQKDLKEIDIFQYEVHLPFQEVTDFLDITAYMEEKIRLIQFHEDQVNICDYDMIAKSLGKYRACQMNQPKRYYEAYLRTDISEKTESGTLIQKEKSIQKYKFMCSVLFNWLRTYIAGKNIRHYLLTKSIKKVIIYGYSNMGKILYQELSQTDIAICGILDKRDINNELEHIRIALPEDGDRSADAVIVTVLTGYNEIKMELEQSGYHSIYSLSEIIEELCRK